MHLALRPYVTTGVALVGASVITAATITPTPPDVRVANPAVERSVALTAAAPRPIENTINALLFQLAKLDVGIATLPAPLVARLLDIPPVAAEALLTNLALGLSGPLIAGPGAIGHALQDLVISEDFEDFLVNALDLIGLPIDGFVNGGYGPNLAPLFPAMNATAFIQVVQVLAGGLVNGPRLIEEGAVLAGTIPTLQGLLDLLLNPHATQSVAALAPIEDDDRLIEDGVNKLLFAATAVTLHLVTLAAPLVAPILGVDVDDAKAFLALGTLGFVGPLISGTGAVGHAVQDLVDSEDFSDFVDNSLDLVRLPIAGFVNGGQGPNLKPLLPFLPDEIPTPIPFPPYVVDIPVSAVYAPGLIQNPGYIYDPAAQGIGLQPQGTGIPSSYNLLTPGTIPTLQGLVTRVFDSNETMALRTSGGDNVTVAGDQKVEPKKRNRPLLNIVKNSPLADLKPAGAKHLPGIGKHPVRDLVNKVLSGGHDDKGDPPKQDPAE